MPETAINDTGLSLSEAAVAYVLARTIRDPQFRYHMTLTDTLHRCCIAEADRRGVLFGDVKSELYEAIEREKRVHPQEAREVELERENDELRDQLRLRDDLYEDVVAEGLHDLYGDSIAKLCEWRKLYVTAGL